MFSIIFFLTEIRDFANMALRPLPAVRAGQEDSAILGQLRSRSANQLAYYQTQMVRGSCSHVKKAVLVFFLLHADV